MHVYINVACNILIIICLVAVETNSMNNIDIHKTQIFLFKYILSADLLNILYIYV
jgi:hypothetical protein